MSSKIQAGKMFIVVGPSGAGKSSFVEKIVAEVPGLHDAITCTTRPMRKGESEGKPYYFLTDAKFRELIKENYFVEWAEVHGKLYGTPREQLEIAWSMAKAVIMDVDVQGARTFKTQYPQATTIFIIPPSIDALRQRVTKRDGKIPTDLEIRMKNAEKEMAMAAEFDHQLVNDDFTSSYRTFKKIIEDTLKSR